MKYWDDLERAVLFVQAKHHDFFIDTKTMILDYIEIPSHDGQPLQFKNYLPEHIKNDLIAQLEKK